MKIISWNVNGLRAVVRKGFKKFVEKYDPDMICLQEIKAKPDQVEIDEYLRKEGYEDFWNSAERKGYSGTLIFTKKEALSSDSGMGIAKHDKEGRLLKLEFEDFFLVDVYVPNSKPDLSRLDYRQVWDKDFLEYLKDLKKKKPVIVCGDFNVAYKEIDLARPKQNEGEHGFTKEERAGFSKFLNAGFVDIFREFNQEEGQYTWWTYWRQSRKRNVGWRLDYFLVSKDFKKNVKKAYHLRDVMGSDHCPIGLEIKNK